MASLSAKLLAKTGMSIDEMKGKLAALHRDCEEMDERLGTASEAESIEWNIREQ